MFFVSCNFSWKAKNKLIYDRYYESVKIIIASRKAFNNEWRCTMNETINSSLKLKYDSLLSALQSLGSVAVAFSGGVDSTFLLYAAKEALGDAAIAVTISADFVSNREQTEAKEFCKEHGIRQYICPANMTEIPHFTENPTDRCYYCKRHIFENILKIAGEHFISDGATSDDSATPNKKDSFVVAEGSNLDDNNDYRPGHRAIAELGIKSPLRDAGFTKAEIREVSRYLGLPTWQKPSFACLASRIPYGDIITTEKLSMIDKAENFLQSLGFSQFRVRFHGGRGGAGNGAIDGGPQNDAARGSIARIELMPEDFQRFMEESTRLEVYERFKEIGFSYVALDIKGYRTGSLNEGL